MVGNLRLLWQYEDMFTISCIKAIYNPHLKIAIKMEWNKNIVDIVHAGQRPSISIARIHCVNVKKYQR